LYFAADDGVHGREFWSYDPVGGTAQLVADVNSGASHSFPTNFTALNGTIYFLAEDSSGSTYQLCGYDPSSGSLVTVTDLLSGSSYETHAHIWGECNGELLISVGTDPYKYDHTLLIFDPDSQSIRQIASMDSYNGKGLAQADGKVYYVSYDAEHGRELWCCDVETGSTEMVADLAPGERSAFARSSGPFLLVSETAAGTTIFFNAYDELVGTEIRGYVVA
jgi:ELWxxDGT repeat protein